MTDPINEPASPPPPGPSFEQRMETFGKDVEGAAKTWSHDPGVKRNLTALGRLWGLVVLAAGVWLFAGVTLGYDLPSVPLRDLWPIALIVLGAAVILRGFARRS